MAIKITGIKEENHYHFFREYYAFIDSENDFFIIGRDKTVIMMTSDSFSEYDYSDYSNIENFLNYEFGTSLLKALKKDDFDIEVTIK